MIPIIVERPYEFVPPYRGNFWPWMVQRLRLFDAWLKRNHGVAAYEIRHVERLRTSLQSGHGILLTPNHCRTADPMVMGWLSRHAGSHFYAMASWHLFNQDWFTAFAIRRMGAFSVYREGIDRKAINTGIEILTNAERPLIVFPEGAVFRTNDRLQALLDGVAFVARSAAKKRLRLDSDAKVVVHPVAIKYLLQSDLEKSITPVLEEIEHRLTWRTRDDAHLLNRIQQIGMGLLGLKEIEHLGQVRQGPMSERLQGLIDSLLHPLEKEWLTRVKQGAIIPRIKALRMKIMPEMVSGEISADERARRWRQLEQIYLVQQLASYPPDYVESFPSVDRILETVERFVEDLTDEERVLGELKVVIEVGEAIEVDPQRNRAAAIDPLMACISTAMQRMLDRLAQESLAYQVVGEGNRNPTSTS